MAYSVWKVVESQRAGDWAINLISDAGPAGRALLTLEISWKFKFAITMTNPTIRHLVSDSAPTSCRHSTAGILVAETNVAACPPSLRNTYQRAAAPCSPALLIAHYHIVNNAHLSAPAIHLNFASGATAGTFQRFSNIYVNK